MIFAEIDNDPGQPGLESGISLKSLKPLHSPQECFLGQVLGRLSVPYHFPGDVGHIVLIPLEEEAPMLLTPGLARFYELFIGKGGQSVPLLLNLDAD